LQGEIKARLPELFDAKGGEQKLLVGGTTFGVRLFTEGVQVVGVSKEPCPALAAGIQCRDRILSINGTVTQTVEDVVKAIGASEGNPLTLVCKRGEKDLTVTLTPQRDTSGKYHIGIWVRDHAAGIGTVTFVDPESGAFGGLGHGICDGDTGALIPLSRGAVMEAEINGVVRGEQGNPGELKGYLSSKKIGTLLVNCDKGVFGILSPIPEDICECVEVGSRGCIHAGKATLRCALGEDSIGEYEIELSDIANENKGTKCFAVHVTDKALIEKTGGIVQGMSGSPILQDGRLVGAVTHVLIGDPTRGYGIFIENMLSQVRNLAG
jgi:stage IV sporulation protein B